MNTNQATNSGAGDAMGGDQNSGVADANGSGDELHIDGLNDDGDGEGEGSGDAGDDQDDDHEEIEHEGVKHRIPKALKSALMMQADYTRKTQEVAEQRRAIEADRVNIGKAGEEIIAAKAKLLTVDEQLKSYDTVDWTALQAAVRTPQEQTNLDAHWRNFSMLKDKRTEAERTLQTKTEEQTQAAHRDREKRAGETLAVLQRDIPGWSQELNVKLAGFALESGFTQEELKDIAVDVRAIKLIHAAYQGKQVLDAQARARRAGAGQNTTPAKSVRGGNGKFLADANTSDFRAFEKLATAKLSKRD